MWTTFINPDNPFFGGMDKLLYQLFLLRLSYSSYSLSF